MHDLEPLFREATYTPRAAAICKSLGYERPTLVQSMYIFKVRHLSCARRVTAAAM